MVTVPKPNRRTKFLLKLLRLANEREVVLLIPFLILTAIAAAVFLFLALAPDAKTRALRSRNAAKAAAKYLHEALIEEELRLEESHVTTLLDDDGTSEEYQCIGWRYDPDSHYQCSPFFKPSSLFDRHEYTCDEFVPDSPGYCEVENTKTGEIKRIVHKPCQRALIPGETALPPYFTCRMALAFANYKHRAKHFQPAAPIPIAGDHSRGIVIEAYGEVLPSVYSILHLLRNEYQCQLPVELWFGKGELDPNHPILNRILTTWPINVKTRVITDETVESYMSKPYSIAYSHFDEILFLDSDNFPLRDPTYLFETDAYKATGAIFWKDFWASGRDEFYLRQDSLLWELLDIPRDSIIANDMEMESGQLVINRRQSRAALQTLLFFSETFKEWFEPLGLVLGDKDLFRFAWYLHDKSFHYIEQPPSMVGLEETNTWHKYRYQKAVCGLTMLQYDLYGQPIFLHRNAVKLTEPDKVGLTPIWERGAKFVGKDPNTQYKVGFHFASHHLLGRMCYHPHPHYRKYFEEEDYRFGDSEHSIHPIRVLEERILFYALEAYAIMERSQTM